MSYLAYTDIQTFLETTLTAAEQAVVNQILPGLEAFVDGETGRSWNVEGNITELFDGGSNVFFLTKPKANEVVSVKVDGMAVDADDIYNYGDRVKLDVVVPDGPQVVEIVYKQASSNLPNDLKFALIRWASEIFKSHKEAGKTITRTSSGPISVDFDTKDLPDYMRRILDRYTLPAL